MKIELNLTSAFTLRKRIKELGRVNEQLLAYSKYVVEPEQVDEELEKFENKNVYDTFMLCSKCGDEAYRLQNLIDEHTSDDQSKVLADCVILTILPCLPSAETSKTTPSFSPSL